MIRILKGSELHRFPALRDAMFRDRAAQFVERHGWEIPVDADGREIDQYDPLDPIYLIVCEGDRHLGSMRFLPSTGRTMVMEHFAHLAPEDFAQGDLVECTRFCIAPGAPKETSSDILIATYQLALDQGWRGGYGIFDRRMVRIYGRIGGEPQVLAADGDGRDAICLGIWQFDQDGIDRMLEKRGIPAMAMAA